MDWKTWGEIEKKRNRWDKRVQAIRCSGCHRLRAHPTKERISCACGSLEFIDTVPHDDELPIALKLYEREIEERNLYGKVAQELIATGGREN